VAERLRRALAETSLALPPRAGRGCDHVYHQFVVRTRRREQLRRHLAEQGVATAVHYPIPIHRSDAYGGARTGPDRAPVASRLAREIVSLPMFPGMSAEQVAQVAEAVRRFDARRGRVALAAGR
jgi:dTDP-4-amino-4,6-dideoxygalactose transaminase